MINAAIVDITNAQHNTVPNITNIMFLKDLGIVHNVLYSVVPSESIFFNKLCLLRLLIINLKVINITEITKNINTEV